MTLSRTIKTGLVVAGITIAFSIFIVVVGLPSSELSTTEQCSIGSPCVQTSTYSSPFSPEPVALVPLLAGAGVVLGLAKKWFIVSWAGTFLLLGFSMVGLLSIGLLYMPLGIALVGLLGALSSRAKTLT